MEFYCSEEFKHEFEKLISNNSYSELHRLIIEYFIEGDPSQLETGFKLNGSSPVPFIKKRLDGSGGYRIYFLLVRKGDSVYFAFLHPKTGSKGYESITKQKRTELLTNIHECIKSNSCYRVGRHPERVELVFFKPEVLV